MATDDEIDEHLFKRGNQSKVWYFRDQRGGDDYRKSLRTRSKAEARLRAKAEKAKRDAKLYGAERVTYHEAALEWAEVWLPGAVEPSTAKRYLVSERQLSKHFRHKRNKDDLIEREAFVDEARQSDLLSYVAARKRAGVDTRTIQRDLTVIGSIWRYAVGMEWRQDNPAVAFDRLLVKAKKKLRPLPPDDEIAAYLARVPPMAGRLVTLLRQSGMRTEEAVLLTRPQILWGEGLQLFKTKWGLARFIPFSECPGAEGTLKGTPVKLKTKTERDEEDGPDYVFWSRKGGRYKNLPSQLAIIRKELGFSWTNHDLRHLFAVEYLRRHKDDPRGWLYKLQQIMGHKSLKTTEEYMQYVEDTTFSKKAQSQAQI